MRPAYASAVVILLLAGCGAAASAASTDHPSVGQDGGTTQDAGTDAAATAPAGPDKDSAIQNAACGLLSVKEIGAAIGVPVQVDGLSEDQVGMSECVWLNDDADLRQVHLQTYDHDVYSVEAWGGTAQPIDDIGDEAFVVPDGPQGVTAGYREGERVVFLTYQAIDSDVPSAVRADQVIGLLRMVRERDC